jgi:hypothetical protein
MKAGFVYYGNDGIAFLKSLQMSEVIPVPIVLLFCKFINSLQKEKSLLKLRKSVVKGQLR